jgi:hypothetical protein
MQPLVARLCIVCVSIAVPMNNLVSYDAADNDDEGRASNGDAAILDAQAPNGNGHGSAAAMAAVDSDFEAWANDPHSAERAERRQQGVRSQRLPHQPPASRGQGHVQRPSSAPARLSAQQHDDMEEEESV